MLCLSNIHAHSLTVSMLADFGINSRYRFIWKTQNDTSDKPGSTKIYKGMIQWHFSLDLILNNSKLDNETHQAPMVMGMIFN